MYFNLVLTHLVYTYTSLQQLDGQRFRLLSMDIYSISGKLYVIHQQTKTLTQLEFHA